MPIANIGAVPDVVTATVIASDWGNAIGAASKGRVVQRFNTPAERDASITAPVAGMFCYVVSTNLFYGYRAGWKPMSVFGARMSSTVVQNLTAGVANVITFSTLEYDDTASAVAATGRYTVPVPGDYLCSGAWATVNLAANNTINAGLAKNGTVYAYGTQMTYVGSNGVAAHVSAVVRATTGDVITMIGTPQAACQVFNGVGYTYLSIHHLT